MKKINISKEIIETELKSGKLKKEICEDLHISIGVLRRLASEYNLDFSTHSWKKGKDMNNIKFPFITKEWLIENWVNTSKSLVQLAQEFDVSEGVLEYRISKYNLTKHYKYLLNTNKFFNISDPNVYYLAGLVATDGYLPKGKNAVEICLVGESERQLLEEIRDYFELSSPIAAYGKKYLLRIAVEGLNDFYKTVFNINDGSKTFTVGVPESFPSEECAIAYVRGCMDGDGSYSKSGFGIRLTTASDQLVYGISNIISKYTSQTVPVYLERDKYPTIALSKRKAKIILNWIYSLDNCFKLDRKFCIYKKVNDMV